MKSCARQAGTHTDTSGCRLRKAATVSARSQHRIDAVHGAPGGRLELADEDPNDSGRILDVYLNESYPKYGEGNTDYNREHTCRAVATSSDRGETFSKVSYDVAVAFLA